MKDSQSKLKKKKKNILILQKLHNIIRSARGLTSFFILRINLDIHIECIGFKITAIIPPSSFLKESLIMNPNVSGPSRWHYKAMSL